MIRLSVLGTLEHRELVLRVVESSCKLVRHCRVQDTGHASSALPEHFETPVVSAMSEAFNNVAIHAYAGVRPGIVELQIGVFFDRIEIILKDFGKSFDPRRVPEPDLGQLPESGMGLYIIRSFMDEALYEPGHPPERPNTLRLTKRLSG
jgi:serine/threonine-protein kinase RsbW